MLRKIHRLLFKILGFEFKPDIALSRDEASRFLPWIIALMVYLAALILAGSFTLSHTISMSRNAQVESFSVHLPHMAEGEKETSDKVLALVKNTAGVKDASLVTTDHIKEMVEPWLGKSEALNSLPLPVIIEGKVKSGETIDYDALKSKVQAVVPGADIDDHKKWLAQFSEFVNVVQYTLMIIAIFIISATAVIVIFACKTSLKIHRNTVNLLHRLGAMDGYIAKQFQDFAALLTLKGSFIGCGLAAFTLLVLHIMGRSINSPLFPTFALSFAHWAILFCLPLIMSLLALIAARVSVLTALHKIP